MKISKVYFNTEDNLRLIGLLHENDTFKSSAVLISVHGITSNCLNYRDEVLAKMLTDNNIAYFTFDNRGHDVLNTYDSFVNMNFQGSCVENVREAYYDIKAAINSMKKKFGKIILQGHSMGCTKVVYTLNKMIDKKEDLLKSICAVSLLSMVDVPGYLKQVLGENYESVITYLKIMKERSKDKLILVDNFPPVRPSTILNFEENSDLDFFKYTDESYNFEKLNNIKYPLFMRWGNDKELITIPANELAEKLNKKITNKKKDIGFIDGANHSYKGKEKVLADELLKFISRFYLDV